MRKLLFAYSAALCIAALCGTSQANLLVLMGSSSGGTPVAGGSGIVPGTLAPGTCVGCTDSLGSTQTYFYQNPWPPQHQPAQEGSPTSPYYNSDVMMVWSGAQDDTLSGTTQECLIGASSSGAASGSQQDYGIDHVTFALDGGDGLNGQPNNLVTVSSAQGDPQAYGITSVTGDGTTATAQVSVPFAFNAPLNYIRTNASVVWAGSGVADANSVVSYVGASGGGTVTVTFNQAVVLPIGASVTLTGVVSTSYPTQLNGTYAATGVSGTPGKYTLVNPAITSGTASATVAGTTTLGASLEVVSFNSYGNVNWPLNTVMTIAGASNANLNIPNALVVVNSTGGTLAVNNSALAGTNGSITTGGGTSHITGGYGDHMSVAGFSGGAAVLNGTHQLTAASPVSKTQTAATISWPSSYSGTITQNATLNNVEPTFWCVPVNPSLLADGLHELRATVYPKIGWPRLMQGPHFVDTTGTSGATTSVDESSTSWGLFNIPAHGFPYKALTIDSVSNAGAPGNCLVPTGSAATPAQFYATATQLDTGLPQAMRPPQPTRGYQLALVNPDQGGYLNMQNCTDGGTAPGDGIVINEYRGSQGNSNFFMPWGGAGGNLNLGVTNNHSKFFFTNYNQTAWNPTVYVSTPVPATTTPIVTPGVAGGVDAPGCGVVASPVSSQCATIDGAIANNPNLNPNAAGNSIAGFCEVSPTNGGTSMATTVGATGACNAIVGQAWWAQIANGGIHASVPYWVVGFNGQAPGTSIAAGSAFMFSSIPMASPSLGGTAPACGVYSTVVCGVTAVASNCNFSAIRPAAICMSAGGDGITVMLAGTPSAPQYYNLGTQSGLVLHGNFAQWFTVQGQTQLGAILNASGHTTYVVDSALAVHQVTAVALSGTSETLTISGTAAGSTVEVEGVECAAGVSCGNPNGAALTVTASSSGSVTVTNTGITGALLTPTRNVNIGNGYSWVKYENLSTCGINYPAINVSPICSVTEPNPYHDVMLLNQAAYWNVGAAWYDNVFAVGAVGAFQAGGCIFPTPCNAGAQSTTYGEGTWITNGNSWLMGVGPLNDLQSAFSSVENFLYSNNPGQFSTTPGMRNVTDDGLAQSIYTQVDCADWTTALGPNAQCNSSAQLTSANIIPVVKMPTSISTGNLTWTTAPTPFGGSYLSKFGWPSATAWFFVPSSSKNVTLSGSGNVQACYDVLGLAPNCPAAVNGTPVAAVSTCVTAGVSCLVLASGGAASYSNQGFPVGQIVELQNDIHADEYFLKDASAESGTSTITNIVTMNLFVPDRACDYTSTDVTCNASEGILVQTANTTDWALLDMSPSQIDTSEPDFGASQNENIYWKNVAWGSVRGDKIPTASRESGFGAFSMLPPGGGEFGNGQTDGFVIDNAWCGPTLSASSGQVVYYPYFSSQTASVSGLVTMAIDPKITIPSATSIQTLAQPIPSNLETTVNNPTYPVSAVAVSGGNAVVSYLPLAGNAIPPATAAAITLPSGNMVSVAGVYSLYTPSAVSWSGQAETVAYGPSDLMASGSLVSLLGSTCSNCGSAGSADFDAVIVSSVGTFPINSATWLGSTGAETISYTGSLVSEIPNGSSVKVYGLHCPIVTGGVPCTGDPNGTFTITASTSGTSLGSLATSGSVTFANSLAGPVNTSNVGTLVLTTQPTVTTPTAGQIVVTNPNLGLYRIASGTWTTSSLTLNLATDSGAASTAVVTGSVTLAGLTCSSCGTISGSFTATSPSGGVVSITGLSLTGSGSLGGSGTLLSVPGSASATLTSPKLIQTTNSPLNGSFLTTAGASGTLTYPTTYLGQGEFGSMMILGYGLNTNVSVAWTPTTETVTFTPPYLFPVNGGAAAVANATPSNLNTSAQYNSISSGVYSIPVGKYPVLSGSCTATTETINFKTASNDVIPTGTSITVALLSNTSSGIPTPVCSTVYNGTFNVISSAPGSVTITGAFTGNGNLGITNSGASLGRNDSGSATIPGTTTASDFGVSYPAGLNIFPVPSVGSTMGQLQYNLPGSSTLSLPLLIDAQQPGAFNTAGFFIVPGLPGEQATSFVNTPPVNACTN